MIKQILSLSLILCFCFKAYCFESIDSIPKTIDKEQNYLPTNTILLAKDKIPAFIYEKFRFLPPYFSIDNAFLKEKV